MNLTDTLPDWNALPGTTLEGGYELKEIVEAEGERALLRVRVLGDYSLRATARFYVLEPDRARDEAGLWQSVRNFPSRTNLDVPLGAGVLSLNGVTVAYNVLQIPEETLEDVLAARALDPEETTDVLRAIARGLNELHANGYVHGCVSPERVLAIGNEIKLSVESLRRAHDEPFVQPKPAKYLAPESTEYNVTTAADIWCVGATVFEALTGKAYESALFEEATALKHPFGTLLERCLEPDPDKRARLSDVETILRSKAPPPKPKPVAVPPPAPEAFKTAAAAASATNGTHSVMEPPAQPTPMPAAPTPSASAPTAVRPEVFVKPPVNGSSAAFSAPRSVADTPKLRNELPLRPEPRPFNGAPSVRRPAPAQDIWGDDEAPRAAAQRRSWIYAISAFVAIFFALLFVRYYSHSVAKRSARVIHESAQQATAQPGAAWPTKTLSPDAKSSASSAAAASVAAGNPGARTVTPASPGAERTVWRVVLYTYYRQEDADRKAQDINARRPDLHAASYSPSGTGTPFLVVAGGQMNREAAAQLRGRALREGMPHDTYIQNFNH